jgi:hypothetical protein
MMERTTLAQAQPTQILPELGRLKAAAQRISTAADNVQYFLIRFHGPQPESSGAQKGDCADSYRNDLESLFGQIDRLEAVVAALEHIG